MDSSFLDIRNHGFARVAVCIPAVRLADPMGNAEAHLRVLEQAYEQGAQYAVCPELGLTGYSSGDLLFQDVLLRAAIDSLAWLVEQTKELEMVISVGMPIRAGGALYNCAVTFSRGRLAMAAPKSYPPNYREFYELRWFATGSDPAVSEIELLGQRIPFGTDIVCGVEGFEGFALHTDICEDLWVPVPPGTIAALSGATILANLSASNITVGKSGYREQLVSSSSAKNLAVQLYSAAGFGESTADVAWDGQGLIADRGEIIAETERFTMDGTLEVVDADLHALATDRMRQTSWGQNAREFARPMREVVLPPFGDREAAPFLAFRRRINPLPYAPDDTRGLDDRCHEVFLIIASSIARRLESLPADARRIFVGVSGGRDSTLALIAAVHAMDLLGKPRSDVWGITMPGFGTSDATYRAACDLVTTLGARLQEIDIKEVSHAIFDAIDHDAELEDVTFENVQAWARKYLLFALTSRHKGFDLGTGDLSELALGWTTYGGDHMSHYAANAGVPKTLVSQLILWAADAVFSSEPGVARALRDVLAVPISPELRRLSPSGEITHLTEGVVGPYDLNDFFLYHFTRFGFGPRRIARMAYHAFDGKFTIGEIKHWLTVFLRRFFANQFKRDCLPDGPKVGSGGSLSPRGDWRMPPDALPGAWLTEAATIPDE